jgi:hypothetical protein
MIHNFSPITGTGKKSQAIRELQKAVRKITPRSDNQSIVNVTSRGTQRQSKAGTGTGTTVQVVSRWL